MLFICFIKKFFFQIGNLKFILWCYLIIYNSLYIYHLKELLNKYYGHIMYLCVYAFSTREKFRDCWRKPEVSIPVFQLMKGKFESVSSTIFHLMQRICFSFVQKLMNKSHSMSVETFKNLILLKILLHAFIQCVSVRLDHFCLFAQLCISILLSLYSCRNYILTCSTKRENKNHAFSLVLL